MLIACASGAMLLGFTSSFKLSPTYTSHQKTHIIKSIMPKKPLIKKQYQKDMFVANARLNDSTTIVFRGKDKKNRMALLTLNVVQQTNAEAEKKPAQVFSLNLSYMLDPKNSDVFSIKIKDDDF